MTDEISNDDDLPDCVDEVKRAAARLYDRVYDSTTLFPDLDESPASVEELHGVFEQAVRWAENVAGAYGEWIASPRDADSVLALFVSQSLDGGPWLAADVLAPLPSRFHESGTRFFTGYCWIGEANSPPPVIQQPRGPEIPLDLEHWPRLRVLLRSGYRAIVAKALGLHKWATERCDEVESALFPSISFVARNSKGRVVVRVTQAGRDDTHEIQEGHADFLADLAEDGEAALASPHKSTLVNREIRELKPWLETAGRTNRDGYPFYRIPSGLRQRLRFENYEKK